MFSFLSKDLFFLCFSLLNIPNVFDTHFPFQQRSVYQMSHLVYQVLHLGISDLFLWFSYSLVTSYLESFVALLPPPPLPNDSIHQHLGLLFCVYVSRGFIRLKASSAISGLGLLNQHLLVHSSSPGSGPIFPLRCTQDISTTTSSQLCLHLAGTGNHLPPL